MTTLNSTYSKQSRSNQLTDSAASSPVGWLRAGWNDLTNAPLTSALLGISFTGICAAAYATAAAMPMFSVTLLAFLLIVSPFIAATGYYTSRQLETSRTASLRGTFQAIRSRALGIGMFSILNALIVAAWVRVSGIAFAFYFGSLGNTSSETAMGWTTGADLPAMLLFGSAAGLLLALVLFAVGALALPMIADRNVNAISAAHNSIHIMRNHIGTILVWMLLLAALITTALASGLLLMPLLFPLLAYATWHSYRELAGSS